MILLAGCSQLERGTNILQSWNAKLSGNQTQPIIENTTINEAIPEPTGPTWTRITFLDIGQGDSILIQTEGHNMLIDCGKYSKAINKLKERSVNRLDYLIITHPDFDHLGGCDEVLDNINVGALIMDGSTKDTNAYNEIVSRRNFTRAEVGQKFSDFGTEFLHANVNSDDSNMNSIVTKVTNGNVSVLLTADCDRECEQQISYINIDSDILQVPHHGSRYGTTPSLLYRSSPNAAIISVGDNSYGHPSPEVMTRLIMDFNLDVYRTDFNGDIEIHIENNNYKIKTER